MDRLTTRTTRGDAHSFDGYLSYQIIERLCAYEDAEECGDLVRVKHGKWILFAPHTHHQPPDYVCSVCNESQVRKTDYCSNCGADMREVDDG